MSADITTYGGYIGGLLAVAWAAYNNFKSGRQADYKENAEKLAAARDELVKTKDAVIATIAGEKEAWRSRFDGIHTEYDEYRKSAHAQLNNAQSMILKLTDDNATLHAKTDMTPVLKNQEQQNEVNSKVLENLSEITVILKDLGDKVKRGI